VTNIDIVADDKDSILVDRDFHIPIGRKPPLELDPSSTTHCEPGPPAEPDWTTSFDSGETARD
jgi:hypothetical protein